MINSLGAGDLIIVTFGEVMNQWSRKLPKHSCCNLSFMQL